MVVLCAVSMTLSVAVHDYPVEFLLTLFSPIASGTEYALRPRASCDWYLFHTPGLISVPAAFLLGGLGSRYQPVSARTGA